MTKVLVFDTETGGFSPVTNDMLQLSYQIAECENFTTLKTVNHYFPYPKNEKRVTAGAVKVNGITKEFLATKTLSDKATAIKEFIEDMNDCNYIVAHNGAFDIKFINAEAARCNIGYIHWKPLIDTMERTKGMFASAYGWKPLKLSELAGCLAIDISHLNLHDSSADVELTQLCFFALARASKIKEIMEFSKKKYDIFVKGIAEHGTSTAMYAIYSNGEMVANGRKQMPCSTQNAKACLCMELYAAYSALYKCDANSEIHFFTNNKAIAAWFSNMLPNDDAVYRSYWNNFVKIFNSKTPKKLTCEWMGKTNPKFPTAFFARMY